MEWVDYTRNHIFMKIRNRKLSYLKKIAGKVWFNVAVLAYQLYFQKKIKTWKKKEEPEVIKSKLL